MEPVSIGESSDSVFRLVNDDGTGYIDLGRFGISDRYLDLGITLNALDHNFGPGYEAIFFEAYGLGDVDWSRIRFYQMLEDFF